MEIRSVTVKTGRIRELRHNPDCSLDVHSSRCMILTTDKRTATFYRGVEVIGGVEHTVTGSAEDPADLVEPPEKEKGAIIGSHVVLARLREIEQERSALTASEPETEQVLVIESAQLRGMLR